MTSNTNILNLPAEIIQNIAKYLSMRDKIMLRRSCSTFSKVIGKIDLSDYLESKAVTKSFGSKDDWKLKTFQAVVYGRTEVQLNRAGLLDLEAVATRFSAVLLRPSTPSSHIIKMCQALIGLPLRMQKERVLIVELAALHDDDDSPQMAALQVLVSRLTGLKGLYVSVPAADIRAVPAVTGILAQPFVEHLKEHKASLLKHHGWLHISARRAVEDFTVKPPEGISFYVQSLPEDDIYLDRMHPHIIASRECLNALAFDVVRIGVQSDSRDLHQVRDRDTRKERRTLQRLRIFRGEKVKQVKRWINFPYSTGSRVYSSFWKMLSLEKDDLKGIPVIRGPYFGLLASSDDEDEM